MSQTTTICSEIRRRPVAPSGRLRTGNRRGGVLPLVAVVMVALLAACALAIDVGMAFTARSEAQRVADAAALAGGSAFMDFGVAEASIQAETRAYEYATRNTVRNVLVDPSEVQVQVIPDSLKVRVTIRRETLPTWFARIFGIDDVDVAARAAAQAVQGGATRCLKPFAVPDIWYDADDDDGDNIWQEGENWEFGSDPGDRYQKWGGPEGGTDLDTGYGSDLRGGDFGREITVKYTDPNSEFSLQPSLFFPIRLPEDPDMESCTRGGGGGAAGASVYRNNICACNNSEVQVGDLFPTEPGNMVGPTHQGINELIDLDPGAYWDPDLGPRGGINGSSFGEPGGFASPRVIKVALFNPETQMQKPGMDNIEVNNFALFFLQEQANQKDPVTARFLFFAEGTGIGEGGQTGSLVLYLRLVE